MRKRMVPIAVLAINLVSCASVSSSIGKALHGYRDLDIPEAQRRELSRQDARNVSWLIREIIPAKVRVDMEKATGGRVDQAESATHGAALVAGTIAAAATGAPLSTTGGSAFGAAGLGISVLGASSTGNWYHQLGRLYLGDETSSAFDARLLARKDMLVRFQKGLLEAGLSAECRTNCQGPDGELPWRVYELSGAPEPLWAIIRFGDMESAPIDPLRDQILGFKPRWQSAEIGRNAGVSAHAIVITREEPKGDVFSYRNRAAYAFDNPKAQKLLRAMSQDGHWVFALRDGPAQHLVAWSGRLFKHAYSKPLLFGDKANLIDYEILE
jgi:hypothetical protein